MCDLQQKPIENVPILEIRNWETAGADRVPSCGATSWTEVAIATAGCWPRMHRHWGRWPVIPGQGGGPAPCGLHPVACALRPVPAPCALHLRPVPAPCTCALCPAPCTLRPAPYACTLCPVPCACALHPAPVPGVRLAGGWTVSPSSSAALLSFVLSALQGHLHPKGHWGLQKNPEKQVRVTGGQPESQEQDSETRTFQLNLLIL